MLLRLGLLMLPLLLVLFVAAIPARAQETQIVVTPAIIDAPAVAGEATKRFIQLTNNNPIALPISVAVQSAVIDGEPIDERGVERYDVSDWVAFEQETYLFESGETRELPFTITPPFTALPGGHYAQISIRGLALEQSGGGQQGLVFPEVSVPLLVTVPGEIIEDANIPEGSIFPRYRSPGEPIELRIPVENTGSVHNLMQVTIVLESGGEVVYEEPLQPGIVLPGTRKEFTGSWSPIEYGEYEAYAKVTYGATQTETRSQVERVVIAPPIGSLALLAITIWGFLYLWPRRGNVLAAIRTLFS